MNATNTLLLALITFIVGFSVPTQTGINAQLGRHLGNPILASLCSFLVGAMGLLGFILLSRTAWPQTTQISDIPWWTWTGGIFGALFITVVIVMAPRLGATTTLSLIVGGQMLASLVFDHYGLLGFPEHPINWLRLLGVTLLVGGVLLIQRF